METHHKYNWGKEGIRTVHRDAESGGGRRTQMKGITGKQKKKAKVNHFKKEVGNKRCT